MKDIRENRDLTSAVPSETMVILMHTTLKHLLFDVNKERDQRQVHLTILLTTRQTTQSPNPFNRTHYVLVGGCDIAVFIQYVKWIWVAW
jgi:hypothetical protein